MEYLIILLWFAVGIIALIAEINTVELISVWFVIGAFVTMIVSAFVPKNYIAQGVTFIAVTVLSFAILRPWLSKKFGKQKTEVDNINTLVGYKGVASTDIDSKGGKVVVNGTTWYALSDDLIKEGESVVVLKEENITLKVEREK